MSSRNTGSPGGLRRVIRAGAFTGCEAVEVEGAQAGAITLQQLPAIRTAAAEQRIPVHLPRPMTSMRTHSIDCCTFPSHLGTHDAAFTSMQLFVTACRGVTLRCLEEGRCMVSGGRAERSLGG